MYFDYGTDIIKYTQKDRVLEKSGGYRDYGFEQEIIDKLKQSHWVFVNREYFAHEGKNITSDLIGLENYGIQLFTNNKKKISVGRISNIGFSYEMDWFEIDGEILVDNEKINLAELFDFWKRKNDWSLYNGQVAFLPDKLKKLSKFLLRKMAVRLKYISKSY